jgi:hypothetical protein
MEYRTRNRHRQTFEHDVVDGAGGGSAGPPPPANDAANIVVSSGIHRGRYPIVGITVGEARRVLSRLFPIDAEAVSVINGAPVGEDHVIAETDGMISFVKRSSLKGTCHERTHRHRGTPGALAGRRRRAGAGRAE